MSNAKPVHAFIDGGLVREAVGHTGCFLLAADYSPDQDIVHLVHQAEIAAGDTTDSLHGHTRTSSDSFLASSAVQGELEIVHRHLLVYFLLLRTLVRTQSLDLGRPSGSPARDPPE